MDNILIVGSSGHAKVVIDAVENEGKYRISGLLDRFRPVGDTTIGYTVLGGEEDVPRLALKFNICGIIVAIGDNNVRRVVSCAIESANPNIPFVTVVHPHAKFARDVSLGGGTVVFAGAIVNTGCRVGRSCILNTNCSLDHDSSMGDYSSLGPGAVTGGNVKLGIGTAVGMGACVLQKVEIGNETVIGAGSVVRRSLGDRLVAYGVPARAIRERLVGDRYL